MVTKTHSRAPLWHTPDALANFWVWPQMTRQRCVEYDAALASLSKRPDILSCN